MLARLAVAALLASATITAVAPNPASDGDAGEFVAVTFDEPTNTTGWTLADDNDAARLPNRTLSGTVALSTQPAAARNRTDLPVVGLNGSLALANSGETVELRSGNETVDELAYPRAPTAEQWNGSEWTPLGASSFAPFAATNVSVSAFALPDAAGPPIETLESAERRLYLAGYTFTSARATRALAAAAQRGVDVRVLVEGSVAGGAPSPEDDRLDMLRAAGVDVRVLDGERARYSFHHAKYAVADDRAVVLSENWKPSGSGGHGNRGWGVTVENPQIADHLARVFRADTSWTDAKPWRAVRENFTVVDGEPATESYPTRFPPVDSEADSVRVLVAPDNARSGVRDLVASANESLVVEQASLERNSAFTNWTIDAARRGVRVRVLLSGKWYARADNRNTTERLNRIAAEENLNLDARLVEPRSRFEKVHVKGAVVDGERALVGSLNWNEHAATENREVVVVVEDDAVADYFGRAFRADWRGGAWRFPVALAVVVAVAAVATAGCARRIEFGDSSDVGRDGFWQENGER
ncbi:phospholipase D-like domain-containing protein [Halobacterium sp. KA-6]|uniref:phospholipase D-like domain-containing protein n=1 Tax=Halobacterium sp. KA-6 TaxID=2896368 RepID=UPI001E52FB59|nr:phospholipase D-like domain-containing protein [Halobacterium sp. KA-6]MCD2202390.1 phospholipase D-like domain-containing protein [Halobacterium sp. KA-6]